MLEQIYALLGKMGFDGIKAFLLQLVILLVFIIELIRFVRHTLKK